MGAENLFYVKSIETHARAFLTLNILSIGTVYPIVFLSNIFPNSRLIQKFGSGFERKKNDKKGEVLRHIQKEFIITYVEMI